jgi:hypothetical protein
MVSMAGAVAAAEPTPSAASAGLSGDWVLTTVTFGNERSERLQLRQEKGKLSGSIYRRGKNVPLTGKIEGGNIQFELKEGDGGKVAVSGAGSWGDAPPADWRARRDPGDKDRPPAPRTLDFEPVEFHRVFSSAIPPVLKLWPGDTVRTRTVDAAGVDEHGKTRVLGGNPQTGPFFVEGAMPGDVLVVRIKRLRLNRTTAISDDGLVDRALTGDYVSGHKDNNFNDVVWNLDADKGVHAREAHGPPEAPRGPRPSDARLRERRAGLRLPADPDGRFGPGRRQHGLQ